MRIKAIIQYDGTNYCGFQRQIKGKTIQGELEYALKKITKEDVIVCGQGRTDAKVHAKHQVIHFDTTINMSEQSWKKALNCNLPLDIYVLNISFVSDDFHSRFSSIKKEYRYYINTKEYDCFKKNYTMHCYNLNVGKMKEAITYFIGEHDFKSFSKYVLHKSTVRNIYEAYINEFDNILEIVFIGNGFLKYMVRIMVGTLIEIGLGKKDPKDILQILESKDRFKAGKTAEPQGLVLYNVWYKGDE